MALTKSSEFDKPCIEDFCEICIRRIAPERINDGYVNSLLKVIK